MEKFSRLAPSKNFQIFDINQPFSFFDFADAVFPGFVSIKRILSQIRQLGGQAMILEQVEDAGDLKEENEDLKKAAPSFIKSETFRLSFFKKAFSPETKLKYVRNRSFLGYAIVKRDCFSDSKPFTRVFESVICISRHPNNFIHGMQDWKCKILGKAFSIKGYLYAQQNKKTNVCAHVAIRSVAARYHPNGDSLIVK